MSRVLGPELGVREDLEWGVREAIYIRAERPSLNKDGGRHNLPTVWNNVLKSRVRGTGTRTIDNSNPLPISS